jgi:hypothetical protein
LTGGVVARTRERDARFQLKLIASQSCECRNGKECVLRGRVAAVRAAASLAKNPGIFIRQDDDDAGQHTAVLVDDTAPDFRGGLVRGNRCSQRHEHHRDHGFEEQRSHLQPA